MNPQALELTAGNLKSILDNIVQGILVLDINGIVTTYNKAAEKILGIAADDVIGKKFWHNFRDEDFGFSMYEALSEKQPITTCTTYTAPNQTNSEIEVVVTFAAEALPGMIVMIKDVTEIRHLQTLANRTSRMKELGEMAAHVAHEIRNPLGGIKGFASLLQRDLADNPPLQQMAAYIVEGTDDLNRLVNQVLNYARPVHPHLESVNLITLLNETKEYIFADTNLDTGKIDISIDSPFQELLVAIDPPLFKSALLNLLVNAIQAMPKGGKILINAAKKHGHVILSITDTGMGISEENISKLYSPFFTTKPEGNGLGLAEVQKVVQAHNGTIDVNSVVGQGTTFVLKLPLQQRKP